MTTLVMLFFALWVTFGGWSTIHTLREKDRGKRPFLLPEWFFAGIAAFFVASGLTALIHWLT